MYQQCSSHWGVRGLEIHSTLVSIHLEVVQLSSGVWVEIREADVQFKVISTRIQFPLTKSGVVLEIVSYQVSRNDYPCDFIMENYDVLPKVSS
jgi:hypothetical protein